MERRDFLKNSLFSLLGVALTSNKALASVVKTLQSDSPKVLLYLIQTVKGDWKIKVTKWVDVAEKRLIKRDVNINTFKPLEIVDTKDVLKRRNKLWDLNNCTGNKGHLLKLSIPLNDEIKKEYIGLGKNRKGAILNENSRDKIKIKANLRKEDETIMQKYRQAGLRSKKMGYYLIASNAANNRPIEQKLESQRKSALSRTGRKATIEHKQNISKGLSGKPKSQEHKKKLSESKIGKPMSNETIEKLKIRNIGEGNPMFGKKKRRIICIHCNRSIDVGNHTRFHGDNCKEKNKFVCL